MGKADREQTSEERQFWEKEVRKNNSSKYIKLATLYTNIMRKLRIKRRDPFAELLSEKQLIEKELLFCREELKKLENIQDMLCDKLPSSSIEETVKYVRKKNGGYLEDLLLTSIREKSSKMEIEREVINQVHKQDFFSSRKPLLSQLIQTTPPMAVTDKMVRLYQQHLRGQKNYSFKEMLSIQELDQSNFSYLTRILDDKMRGYTFIDRLGVRRPKVKMYGVKAETLLIEPNTVIKPVDAAGSRGVYLIEGNREVIKLRDLTLHKLEELIGLLKDDIRTGNVDQDLWLSEERISGTDQYPLRDLKFYVFYGKVGLILDTVKWPEQKYCWFDRNGKQVTTGKYSDREYQGGMINSDYINRIEDISKKIPIPFIRLDFLETENEFIFGEFTPKPGNFEEFSEEWDMYLGELWQLALRNVQHDLLKDGNFTEFKSFYSELMEV